MAKKGPKKKEIRQANAQAESPVSFSAPRPFPLWAKILIALVITGQLGLLIVFCTGMINIVDLLKQSVDPVYVKQHAKAIADFADPLPAGFEYRMGFAVTSSGVVSIAYKPDQSEFMFGAPPETDLTTARQRVDAFVENGIPNVAGTLKAEEKSTVDIAGRTFEYTRATAGGAKKDAVTVFIAATVLPNNRAILIFARTPGPQFNMSAAKTLFAAVRKFNVPSGLESAAKPSASGNIAGSTEASLTTDGQSQSGP